LRTNRELALAELTYAVNVARLCARWLAPSSRALPRRGGAERRRAEVGRLQAARRLAHPRAETAGTQDRGRGHREAGEQIRCPEAPAEKKAAEINIDQFAAMDLRMGKVLSVEKVPKKDKLLKLTIDLGEGTPRTIVSGVAKSYAPEELVGKNVAVVANLPPRDFGKGLVSHGMVLYAEGGEREHTAVVADVKPGSKVK